MNLVRALWPFLAFSFFTSVLLVGMMLYPLTGLTAFEYRTVEATDNKLRAIDSNYPVTSIATKAFGLVADVFSGAGRRVFHPFELPRTSDRDWKAAIAKRRKELDDNVARDETRKIACQVARLDHGDYSTDVSTAIEAEAISYSRALVERINQSADFPSLREGHKGAWIPKIRLAYSCSRLPQVREIATTLMKELIDSISRGATAGFLPAFFIGDKAKVFRLDTVVTNAGRWAIIGAVIGATFFSGRVLKGAADVMSLSNQVKMPRFVHFIQRHPKTTAVLLVAFSMATMAGTAAVGKLLAK
jgi:hypothetical protein